MAAAGCPVKHTPNYSEAEMSTCRGQSSSNATGDRPRSYRARKCRTGADAPLNELGDD